MKKELPLILVIDDERNTREGMREAFSDKYRILLASSAEEGMKLIHSHKPDMVLTDLRMPGMDGMAFTRAVTPLPNAPLIIMLTAYGSVQTAMEAMRAGAYDYLTKPVQLDALEMMIDRGLEELRERRQDAAPKSVAERTGIIGASPRMLSCIEAARQVAAARSTVLLTGESGTGKEMFARAIHQWSPRANKPFVAVHCAALNENLLESELFGHEKGAFSGATERVIGRFERADHGTLFLDEIGEISLSTQVKLLRVLETRNIERVGGTTTIPIDVRLIAATNRDLKAMAAEGTFREDLFYRLHVVNLHLPSLREHPEDIPELLQHFLEVACRDNDKSITGISPEATTVLNAYSWPGNIRELRNAVERMVVLARGNLLTLTDIPREIVDSVAAQFSTSSQPATAAPSEESAVAQPAAIAPPSLDIRSNERAAIRQALEQCGGNRTRAAAILGISRRTLQRKLKQDPALAEEFPEHGNG